MPLRLGPGLVPGAVEAGARVQRGLLSQALALSARAGLTRALWALAGEDEKLRPVGGALPRGARRCRTLCARAVGIPPLRRPARRRPLPPLLLSTLAAPTFFHRAAAPGPRLTTLCVPASNPALRRARRGRPGLRGLGAGLGRGLGLERAEARALHDHPSRTRAPEAADAAARQRPPHRSDPSGAPAAVPSSPYA